MLWEAIDYRNGSIPVQQGAFIFDIPYFNREVIREALNNAIAHRDYTKTSEVNIKQFDNELHIISPGGFPLGVSVQNLLTVNSTPRNRLLSDVLAKTGIVERSGQGVDKIYFQTLSEAKPEPDYSHSDNFQVELRLSASVEDKGFALFIRSTQNSRNEDSKLGVQDIIALNDVRKGVKVEFNNPVFQKLESEGLIERIGKTRSQKFILSKEYYQFTGKESQYSQQKNFTEFQLNLVVINHIQEFGKTKIGELEELLKTYVTRDQVKYLVKKLVDSGTLEQKGTGKGTYYVQGSQINESIKLFERVLQLGVEEMQKRGELPNE